MAVFRMFYINFWRDAFVVDLTPEERYFYIYTMTNPNTNQCGIYQISKKTMGFETGFNEGEVDNLLNRLTECGYIEYSEGSKEIMITNWIRENFINSPNNIKSLNGELKKVVSKDFLQKFYNICADEEYPLDKLFQGIKLNSVSNAAKTINNISNTSKTINSKSTINTTSILDATKSNISSTNSKTINTENNIIDTSNTINCRNIISNIAKTKNAASTINNTSRFLNNNSNTATMENNTSMNDLNTEDVIKNSTVSNDSSIFDATKSSISNTINNTSTALNTLDTSTDASLNYSDATEHTAEAQDPLIPLESSSAFETLDPAFKSLIKLFSSNIHPITPLEYVKLYDWSKDIEPEAMEIAILEAVNHNARSMSYINCILNNWLSLGIKSKAQVENYQREWNEKQSRGKNFKDYSSGDFTGNHKGYGNINYQGYNANNHQGFNADNHQDYTPDNHENYSSNNYQDYSSNSTDCNDGNYRDFNGNYYCIPNVSAYDYVEIPEFENSDQ
ncbi:DnaD domain-containing protein [Haloimpatiens lingqiaonensis]|uniref:DnaD domain-containing protein n=1 Tax=Haloimpatiens lingqiaonensis TaxID=1380675 RepID=UPI0010FD6EE3|nr:DnaD domain protein [Haloimpatiens lingqiaonensis]